MMLLQLIMKMLHILTLRRMLIQGELAILTPILIRQLNPLTQDISNQHWLKTKIMLSLTYHLHLLLQRKEEVQASRNKRVRRLCSHLVPSGKRLSIKIVLIAKSLGSKHIKILFLTEISSQQLQKLLNRSRLPRQVLILHRRVPPNFKLNLISFKKRWIKRISKRSFPILAEICGPK